MKINKNSFVFRFCRIFTDNSVNSAAAEMSYYLLFAFFPMIMVSYASLSLAGKANPQFIRNFAVILPDSVSEIIDTFIMHISSSASNISFLVTGIILTLLSVSKFTKSVKSNVRRIYAAQSSQSVIAEWILSVVFSVLLLAVFFVTLFAMILGEHILKIISKYILITDFAYNLIQFLRYFITVFVILLILSLFYFLIPNVRQKLTDVLPGTLFTLASWLLVSYVFAFYMNNFARYSVVYGSLGAFIILLLWLYMTCMLLIVGAILNSMIYNRKRNIKLGYIIN